MKILLVITKAEIGGAQSFVLTLARGLKRNGFQVFVAFGDGDFLPQELEKENIPFFYLKDLRRSKNPLLAFLFIYELKKLIDREGFNIVHFNSTNALPGVFAAKLSNHKVKTVFTVHGLSVLDPKYQASFLQKIIFKIYFKFFLGYINSVVFVSEDNLTEAFKQGIKEKNTVIYYGLEITPDYFLDKDNARKELEKLISKNLEDVYLIGSIGRLAEQKNYDFMINAWPEIKKIKTNAMMIIIGEGSERSKYQNLIKKNNCLNEIFLPGEIKYASRFLKGFDLFVLPSIYEGLPISLIEVLFSGIHVLASDVGGNKEVMGIVNCFKLNDELDFLRKLKSLTLRKNTLEIERTLKFKAENMVLQYIKIYKS